MYLHVWLCIWNNEDYFEKMSGDEPLRDSSSSCALILCTDMAVTILDLMIVPNRECHGTDLCSVGKLTCIYRSKNEEPSIWS